ncbi:hypothetical protein D3C80_1712840 [compost metagenome]
MCNLLRCITVLHPQGQQAFIYLIANDCFLIRFEYLAGAGAVRIEAADLRKRKMRGNSNSRFLLELEHQVGICGNPAYELREHVRIAVVHEYNIIRFRIYPPVIGKDISRQ